MHKTTRRRLKVHRVCHKHKELKGIRGVSWIVCEDRAKKKTRSKLSSLEPGRSTNTHVRVKVEKWRCRVRQRTARWTQGDTGKRAEMNFSTVNLKGFEGEKSQLCGFHTLLQSHVSWAASDFSRCQLGSLKGRRKNWLTVYRAYLSRVKPVCSLSVRLRKSLLSTSLWLTMFDLLIK